MTSGEIREQFLDFFKKKGHRIVASSPVVPYDDPTLLFTNAGMNQFKDVFLGTGTREYNRAANTQKCIRVSGKHNDLEEVGYDTYHHTFFEMLGNWSFGDYYKKEAISWAWELLTNVWKLPKERLWATVYETDDEAFNFWKTVTDINHDHILKFGEKDNFWEMGETGPCGPCSEIHINLLEDYDNPIYVNMGSPVCIEIWNLVFIQNFRDADGKLHDLPAKHVDTGMGFERICRVLQKESSNYKTDIFSPIIKVIQSLSGVKYNKMETIVPINVIADHIRTLTFAIGDGAVPGNDGRGYVLRRILRRAARYGRKINLHEPFLYKLVQVLVSTMGEVFPEIKEKQDYIEKIIRSEEESFNATLDRGIDLFEKIVGELQSKKKSIIPGDDVFKLYDTYGFPVDLTNVMAKERGLSIDEPRFNVLMQDQKQKGRDATKEKLTVVNININDLRSFDLLDEPSVFTGYDELKSDAKIIGYKKNDGKELIILNKTPFYVEAGGQVDDLGHVIVEGIKLNVIDLVKIEDKTVHVIENDSALSINVGIEIVAEVDGKRRWDIMRNHSATHFMHAAMRKILGTHVQQAGSYVGPDRLRFDFAHFAKLSESEISDIESLVNEKLLENIPLLHHRNIPFNEAKKMGALMFFGDKYGDKVNVVQFGDFTMEFCGGTHVQNSSQIGLFKIISESSIASGVRRIEALTGFGIEKYINQQLNNLRDQEEKYQKLVDENKHLEKDIAVFKLQSKLVELNSIISNPSILDGINIYKGRVNAENMSELMSLGEELRNKITHGIGTLVSEIDGKASILTVVTDDLIKEKKLNAGKIVGELARLVDGKGGGRPHLATAGGKNTSKIEDVLLKNEEVIKKFV